MAKVKITNSQRPDYAGALLRVIASAVICIRREKTALRLISDEQGRSDRTAHMLANELCRQRAADMPVREMLVFFMGDGCCRFLGAAGTEWTRQMREVLMTLLMWLVELDDATVILHDRIMEEQNKKGD